MQKCWSKTAREEEETKISGWIVCVPQQRCLIKPKIHQSFSGTPGIFKKMFWLMEIMLTVVFIMNIVRPLIS